MKKLFLITIILLLQCFPSYGSLEGKSLMCKCEKDCKKWTYNNNSTPIYHFFEFNKDKYLEGFFYVSNDIIKISTYQIWVEGFPKKIWIKDHNLKILYQLDRQTLILHNLLWEKNRIKNCKIFLNDNFDIEKQKIKDLLQIEVNNFMKKNKI